jgi:cytochrome c peroxidase
MRFPKCTETSWMSLYRKMFLFFIVIVLTGCGDTTVDLTTAVTLRPTQDQLLQAALQEAGVTPLTQPVVNEALADLGNEIFFDREISGNRDISCATCHSLPFHTGDNLTLSIGTGGFNGIGPNRQIGVGRSFDGRHAPDCFNRGTSTVLTLAGGVQGTAETGFTTPAGDETPDGLDSALAAFCLLPINGREELRGDSGDLDVFGNVNEIALIDNGDFTAVFDAVMARLLAIPEYVALFQAAYPDVPVNELGIQHYANALAAFMIRDFTFLDAPFDRYLAGDLDALSDAQKRGGLLYFGKARCGQCHNGPLLSDEDFHNVGVPQLGPGEMGPAGSSKPLDFGRELANGDTADRYKFRTLPLRNVELTAPYFHDGAFATLEAAVDHMLDPVNSLNTYTPQIDPRLLSTLQLGANPDLIAAIDPIVETGVELSAEEKADLIDFLRSLTSPSALDQSASGPPGGDVPSGLPLDFVQLRSL